RARLRPALRRRGVRVTGRLRTVSLRRRVTVLSLTVLAAVLLVVGVLTDVVFTAQVRFELRQQLNVRAALAGQLVAQGVPADEVARRVEAPGIRAELVTADGRVYAGDPDEDAPRLRPPWRDGPPGPDHRRWWDDDDDDGGWGSPQVLEEQLADGSRLTLVASGGPVSGAQ